MARRSYTILLLGLLLLVPAHTTQAQEPQPGFAISSPTPGETVPQRSIAVRGTGVPGAKAVWDRGVLHSDAVATVDPAGRWSINVPLTDGPNSLTFRQESPDAGPIPLTVTYQPDPTSTDTQIGIGPFTIDLSDWTLKFIHGAWKAAGGAQIEGLGNQVAALMLTNPDVTMRDGGMGPVQDLVNAFLAVSIPLLLVIWVPTVWRFCYGRLTEPSAALTRLTLVIFMLGFYRFIFRYAVEGSNALTYTVLDVGGSVAGFGDVLRTGTSGNTLPGLTALWVIVGIVGLVFVLFLGVMRLMAFAYLLLLYVFGPLVIPLWLHPTSSSYFDYWWRSVLRVLAWSVVWAVEFKLFAAVVALASAGNVASAAVAPLVGLALVFVMYKTPKAIPGPTPMQGWDMVSRQVTGVAIHRATTKVVQAGGAVATGGASAAGAAAGKVGSVVTGTVSGRAARRTSGSRRSQ